MSTSSDIQMTAADSAEAKPTNFASRLLSRAITERQKNESKKFIGGQGSAQVPVQNEKKEPIALAK